MLDDDDLDFAVLVGPVGNGSGCVGITLFLISLAVIIAIAVVVSQNHDECAKRTCPERQKPVLMHHECLCVTEAK